MRPTSILSLAFLLVALFFIKEVKSQTSTTCYRQQCPVWACINKQTQCMSLYLDGRLQYEFPVSTGIRKRETPRMEMHPQGPLLLKHTSRKFPGGNYQGMGNMPYAVFVKGGYAIHGTTMGNYRKLGQRASHGCIRLHPLDAKIFFETVQAAGLDQVWISVVDDDL
jgi:lipoprotein-anchoring transpeptidase ErfK/SrfK